MKVLKIFTLLLVSSIFLTGCTLLEQDSGETNSNQDENLSQENVIRNGSNVEVTMSMQNFSYSPSRLTVRPGDTVKITLTNVEDTHDFVIDEFNVQSGDTEAGETKVIEFTVPADASGEFSYYCSIGIHRELGMKGTLIVE